MSTILIADDEPPVRRLVSATLQPLGHTILQAENGRQAWELVQARHPEIAILDVMMPGLDGLQLAQMIRDDPRFTTTRVVMLSARAQKFDIETGMLSGADLYLTKPFSPRELRGIIAKLIEGYDAEAFRT